MLWRSIVCIARCIEILKGEGTRWFTITDNSNKELKIISKDKMSFSALHFSDKDV